MKGKFSTVYSPRRMRRKSFDDISFGSVSALAMCCVCNFRAVKMFHLSAISRQDVPSFGGGSCVCVCCVCCACNFRAVKMFHLLAGEVGWYCV